MGRWVSTLLVMAGISAGLVTGLQASSAFAQSPQGPDEWRVGIDPANKRVSLYASTREAADMRVVCTPKISAWMMRLPKLRDIDNSAQVSLVTDIGARVASRTVVQQRDTFTIVTALAPDADQAAIAAIAGARNRMTVQVTQAGKLVAEHTFVARYSTPAAAAFKTACAKQRN